MLSAANRKLVVQLVARMPDYDGKVQQIRERMEAMSQTFEHLHGVGDNLSTDCHDVGLGLYLDSIHDAVRGQQGPEPATTSQTTTPAAAAASMTDDSSSLHTLDFAAQQEEIVAAVMHANAVVDAPAAIPDAGIGFDSPFDGVDNEFVPKDELEMHQMEVDFMRDSSPVERKAVPPPPPPLPTPAASSPVHRREIPPRKTRSQTATSSRKSLSAAPRGRSARSSHSRLSAVPSVSSPLAGSSSTRFTSTFSPSPSPPVKLDLDNPDPRAVKVMEGLAAISASFRGDDNNFEEYEVPDELFAAPIPVAAPVPVRVKQPYVPAKRGRKRIKRDEDAEDGIAPATVLWPALIVDPQHVAKVGCDRCGMWYHYGCVGFTADVVLAEEQRFECPPCLAEIRQGKDVDPERAIKAQSRVQPCGRSDCELPRMDVDEYFVERIIGRRPSPDEEGGLQYYIKWDGYDDIVDATWQSPDTLPSQVAQRLIQEFERQATIEGIDVADMDEAIVLNEVHLSNARELKKGRTDQIP